MLDVGTKAPEFKLLNDRGEKISLSRLLKKGPLILYFYPADFTPGCTKEACSIRDIHDDLAAVGLTVAGVSPQEWVDAIAEEFIQAWAVLGISYDDFIRTTEDRHHRGVEELIRRVVTEEPAVLTHPEPIIIFEEFGDTEARCHAADIWESVSLDLDEQFLCCEGSGLDAGIGQQQDEFLTAPAGKDVGVSDVCRYQLTELLEYLVADLMTVRIVNLFEVIKVAKYQ